MGKGGIESGALVFVPSVLVSEGCQRTVGGVRLRLGVRSLL